MSRRTTLPTLLAAALGAAAGGCNMLATQPDAAASGAPFPAVHRGPVTPVTATRPPDRSAPDFRPVVLYDQSRDGEPLLPPLPDLKREKVAVPILPPDVNPAAADAVLLAPSPAPAVAPAEQSAPPPRAEAPPAKPDPPLVAVFRAFLDNRPDDGFALLKNFDKPNQDLLLCLVPLVARLSEKSLRQADREDLAVMVDQLQSALAPLRAFAALRVEQLCFCRKVDDNVYRPLGPKHAFRPGEVVLLYLAPRNFSCTPIRTPDGAPVGLAGSACYRAEWTCKVEVQTAEGRPVAPPEPPIDAPPSCKPPQHYFEVLCYNLPPLAPGHYRLVVEILDRPTTRTARRTLDFVVADTDADLRSAR